MAAEGAGATASPLRVMVYNIRAGKDMQGVENLDRVAALVRQTGADLVLLQEVDRGTERSGNVDQLVELERLTGFHGAFGNTLDYQGGQYGIAVLSRWPIRSDTLIPLIVDPPQPRAGGAYEPRGALQVRVDAPGGVVGVLNTHLDARADDRFRIQEVATIVRVAGALRSRHPRTVVGGDFNAEPGTRTIEAMLEAGWTDAWAACQGRAGAAGEMADAARGLTFPADAPVKRIDYLFMAPGLECDDAEVRATTASDHRPLLFRIR